MALTGLVLATMFLSVWLVKHGMTRLQHTYITARVYTPPLTYWQLSRYEGFKDKPQPVVYKHPHAGGHVFLHSGEHHKS